jgi:hypothetical protein
MKQSRINKKVASTIAKDAFELGKKQALISYSLQSNIKEYLDQIIERTGCNEDQAEMALKMALDLSGMMEQAEQSAIYLINEN